MKATIQEVEGRLQDVHVRGAALATQLAHCKRCESSVLRHPSRSMPALMHIGPHPSPRQWPPTDHFSLGDHTQAE